jgi:hypothetical protein
MKITYPLAGAVSLGLVFGFTHGSSFASDTATPIKLAGVWKLNKELSDNPRAKMMEAMRERGGAGGGRGMGGQGGGGVGGGGGMGGGGGRGGGGGGRGGGGMAGGGGGRGAGAGGGGMERGGRGGPGTMGGGGMMGGEPPLDGAPDGDRPEGVGPRGQGASGERPQGPPPDQAENGGPGGRRGRGGMGPFPSPQFTIEQEGDNLAFRTENNLRLLHSDGQKRKKEGETGPFEVVTRFTKGTLLIESKSEMGGKRKENYTLLPDGKLQIDIDLEGAGRMPPVKFKLVYEAAPAAQF